MSDTGNSWPVLRATFAIIGGPHEDTPVFLTVLANPQDPGFRALVRTAMGIEPTGQSLSSADITANLSGQDFEVELGLDRGQRLTVKRLLRVIAENDE